MQDVLRYKEQLVEKQPKVKHNLRQIFTKTKEPDQGQDEIIREFIFV